MPETAPPERGNGAVGEPEREADASLEPEASGVAWHGPSSKRNILSKLFRFCRNKRSHEDPLTEILAYLLETEPHARKRFVALVTASRNLEIRTDELRIATQVPEPECCFDLVLDSRHPPVRIIVEAKTISGETGGSDPNEGQVERYLRLTREAHKKTYLAALSPYPITIRTEDARWLGRVSWQQLHDTFAESRFRLSGGSAS